MKYMDNTYIMDRQYHDVVRARTKEALIYIKAGQLTLIQISQEGKTKGPGALPKGCWQVILGAGIRREPRL